MPHRCIAPWLRVADGHGGCSTKRRARGQEEGRSSHFGVKRQASKWKCLGKFTHCVPVRGKAPKRRLQQRTRN